MSLRIILASASPRRKALLEQMGIDFQVMVSNEEEKVGVSLPEQVVEELSLRKALAVFKTLPDAEEDMLVIGSDTVVALGERILGKPGDIREAEDMLRHLSGKTHEVYTGVALLYRSAAGEEERKVFYERTKVTFYPMTEEEISAYAAEGECLDKAGAYGIQGSFARYIRGIEGDYNNVVGLPAGRLYQEAKEWLGR